MKAIKSFTAIVAALAVLGVTSAFAGESCCDKAKKDGKTCEHPCCVKAAKDGKVCEKCNKKEDKK